MELKFLLLQLPLLFYLKNIRFIFFLNRKEQKEIFEATN